MLLDHRGKVIDPARIEAVRRTNEPRVPTTSRVGYASRTQSGQRIDPDRALTISAVWACIRYLSQSIAKLPWRVRRANGTNSTIQASHPVDRLLNKRSSPEWSALQFRETMLCWALRWGNGYAEIERGADGRPIALWPIHPTRVTVLRDPATLDLYYRIQGNGQIDLNPEDVFHLRGLGEGPVGLSVMAYAAESLGWARASMLFGAAFFGNGAQLSGIVKMKKRLAPEAMKILLEDFKNLYSGKGANSIAILDNEMEYEPIGIEPEKGQFIETNKYLISEVARWFGVPPHKIYDLDRATFSNIEQQSIEVVEDTLRPWAKRFEDEADYKLFGQNRGYLYTLIDFRSLLRPDTNTRMAYYQGLRNIGVLSANEIRDEEDLNSIPEDQGGDKYTMQSGMTTLDKIGAQVKAPLAEATPSPQASALADAVLRRLMAGGVVCNAD
jgi:HK97 family phage portal protein